MMRTRACKIHPQLKRHSNSAREKIHTTSNLAFYRYARVNGLVSSSCLALAITSNRSLELQKIAEWFSAIKLSLTSDKTNYILIRSLKKKTIDCSLYINSKSLTQTNSTKFQGVVTDQHLTWREHIISLISKKRLKSLGVIARIKNYLPNYILLNLYFTNSHIYLIAVIGP